MAMTIGSGLREIPRKMKSAARCMFVEGWEEASGSSSAEESSG